MRNFTLCIILIAISFTYLSYGQSGRQVIPQKQRMIGEFLKEEFSILPGDQFYRAQDLWQSIGSKKMNLKEPLNSKSKDISKSLVVEDVSDFAEGYLKFVYNSKNETINSISISSNNEKGDFLLDTFIEMEGQYQPSNSTLKNVDYVGRYIFDDFTIIVTGFSNEDRTDFVITKNPSNNKLNR